MQASRQYNVAVIGALGARCVRRDVGAVGSAPAEVVQPSQGRLLDLGFGKGGHGASQGLKTSTSRRSKSATLRVATALALAIPATKASPMSTVRPERRAFARNSATHSSFVFFVNEGNRAIGPPVRHLKIGAALRSP